MISGTPAFAKPVELYNMLAIIRPDAFKKLSEFGNRYCEPKISYFSNRMEYHGCNNQEELNYILNTGIMIRRMKKDVLAELPEKTRSKIPVNIEEKYLRQI